MRISDWSSDVCSSDLARDRPRGHRSERQPHQLRARDGALLRQDPVGPDPEIGRASCRERVCSVRVDLGGRRIIKKNITTKVNMNVHNITKHETLNEYQHLDNI